MKINRAQLPPVQTMYVGENADLHGTISMTNQEDPPLRYVDSKSLSSLKAPPTHGHGIWWIVNLIICCENCVKDTELYILPHLFPVFRVIVKNALALKFNVDLTTRFEFGAQHDFQSCTFGCQFCQTHLLLMSHSSTLETTGMLAPVDARQGEESYWKINVTNCH